MKGRKPTPTHLKLLQGNPGKRAINQNEPLAEGDLFDAPEWLSDQQKENWCYAIANSPAGLLKRLDRAMLAIWVVAEDRHRDAVEQVNRHGSIVRSPNSREPMQNPYLSVVNKQALIMMKAGSELGFAPTSRSRINLGDGKGGKVNPFSRFTRD